jgi:hypothetical protein
VYQIIATNVAKRTEKVSLSFNSIACGSRRKERAAMRKRAVITI